MPYNTLRAFLLAGWAITIIIVVIAYAVAFVLPPLKPDPQALVTNMAAIIGLLSPHLTLIYEFFLSHQRSSNRKLPKSVAYTMMVMCTLYWTIFVAIVWVGVVTRMFGSRTGEGLEMTTSVVVAIAGTLSFLAIKPTTKLFILATEETAQRKSSDVSVADAP